MMQIFDDGSTLSDSGVATNATDTTYGSPGYNDLWQNLANQTLSLGFGYTRAKLQQNLNESAAGAVPTTAPARPVNALPILGGGSDPMLLLIAAGLVGYLIFKD